MVARMEVGFAAHGRFPMVQIEDLGTSGQWKKAGKAVTKIAICSKTVLQASTQRGKERANAAFVTIARSTVGSIHVGTLQCVTHVLERSNGQTASVHFADEDLLTLPFLTTEESLLLQRICIQLLCKITARPPWQGAGACWGLYRAPDET